MKALLEQIVRSLQPLGTTLVVGAGAGSDLPALRTLLSERLVLAEAHAPQADQLARRILPANGEEVWPLAIVATPSKQATLHILNNPHFNSLKPPTDVARHYPNLRVISQAEVATRTIAHALDSLALDANRAHLLILDAPGQANELLSAMAAHALQSFTWIILRCGAAPLYANDKVAQDLLDHLAKVGFDAGEEDPQSLYPQASFLLTRNESRVEKLRLEASLAQARTECGTLSLFAEKLAQDIELLAQDRDQATALAQKYKAQLDAALKDAAAEIDKQAEDLDKQARLAEQHKAELDKANQATTEQRKLANDRHSQIQKLTQECDERSKLEVQHKTELDKANQTVAELQKLANDRHATIQKIREELAEAHQTSSLSVRLQTLREADLRDLQDRYSILLGQNENQHHLLAKLSERLTVAADYFHQLTLTEQQNPSLDERIATPVTKPSTSRKSSEKRSKAQ